MLPEAIHFQTLSCYRYLESPVQPFIVVIYYSGLACECRSSSFFLTNCPTAELHPQHPGPCARAASAIPSARWCRVHNPFVCTYICKQRAGHTCSIHGRHPIWHARGRDVKLSTRARMERAACLWLPFMKLHPRFLQSVLRKKRDDGKSLVAWWDFWIALYLFPWYTGFQSLI